MPVEPTGGDQMSRATAYREAAADLRRTGSQLADLALLHRHLDAAAIGASGPVADTHEQAITDTRDQLTVACDELERLAGVCEYRATVCDTYAGRLARWHALPLIEKLTSLPPTLPARWVVG